MQQNYLVTAGEPKWTDPINPLALTKLRKLIKAAKNEASQDDTPQDDTPQNDTSQDDTSQDDTSQDDTSQDDTSQDGLTGMQSADELIGEDAGLGNDLDDLARGAMREEALSDSAPADLDSASAELEEAALLPELETDAAPDSVLHQEGLLANLRTTQKRLPRLAAPADPARRQELVRMLKATQDAIALTLVRWGVQA